MTEFTHLTSMAKIVCHLNNDIYQFQVRLPLFLYGIVSQKRTENITGNRAPVESLSPL